MAIDKGGGLRGEGGTLADATDPVVVSRITNREQQDAVIGLELSDAELQTIEPEGETTELDTKQYVVKGVGGDVLLCKGIVSGIELGQLVLVAKQPELRRISFDGLTLNGRTYEYQSSILRTVEEDGLTIEQTISPAYITDETIIYATLVNTTDVEGVNLIDLNVASRTWQPTAKRRIYLVIAINADTLTCVHLIAGVQTEEDPVTIAKPKELQQSTYDGFTVDGKDYTYSTPNLRNADDGAENEDQLIIPKYITDFTEITAILIEEGTGIPGVNLQDITPGRAWAKVSV